MLALLVVLFQPAAQGAGQEAVEGSLVVFHAGSLAMPMDQICREFSRLNPEVKIKREVDGSRNCARKISELGRACDVFASADHRVIDEILIPAHASWNIRFASNEMVVAMRPGQARANGVNTTNVFDRLLSPEVVFGRSDPNADPCGYRSVHVFRLAGLHLKRPGLADSLLALHRRHIRPKETDLLALLEMGEIDCILIYRSVAVQHGLDIIELPPEVDLGDPRRDDWYRKAWADVTGSRPGETTRIHGEAMVYGVTIPTNSPNPAAALAFVRFLLSNDLGGVIMKRNGQPSVVPAVSTTFGNLPAELRSFAKAPDQ